MQERFEWFTEGDDNTNVANKRKLISQHFGRALKRMPQRKWAYISNQNRCKYTLVAFREKAQRLIWDIFGDDTFEEQCVEPDTFGVPVSMSTNGYGATGARPNG